MTHEEALAWWYQRVDFEKKPATARELKLERMRELLHRLGDPHESLLIVHIAGSKGKGSTAAMIESIGRSAGYRTGLFTSPHLTDVRERFQVDGRPITWDELTTYLSRIRPAADAMAETGEPPTFFEIATALGFLYFAHERVELAAVEVGLGGRLDSTNVVSHPAVTVITSISYEHVAILGSRLAQIATEKCGIIKPGVPVISGVTVPEAAAVVRQTAQQHGCPLQQLGAEFEFDYQPGHIDNLGHVQQLSRLQMRPGNQSRPYELGLLGHHQAANASLAVQTFMVLASRLPVSAAALHTGLREVRWPARMEVFPGRPPVVLDCAHNVASARALVETLDQSFPAGPRALVFASSADKDVPGILAALAPAFQTVVVTRFHNNPRSTPTERLLAILRDQGRTSFVSENPLAALEAARQSGPRLVVVAGSAFLAGELRPDLLVKPCGSQQ